MSRYIGKEPSTTNYPVDFFTGDDSTAVFVLSESPATANAILVTIDGVVQQPTNSYTISSNQITFTEAPITSIADNISVVHLGVRLEVSQPADGSVGLTQLSSTMLDNDNAVDPTVTDDSASGYGVGSVWINTTTDISFICVDASVGTAVWSSLSSPILTMTDTRVGIGISNPVSELDIRGTYVAENGGLTQPIVNITSTNTAGVGVGGTLQFNGETDAAQSPYAFGSIKGAKEVAGANWKGYMAFFTTSSGSVLTERMRIDSTGQVGIGITPIANLHIGGAGNRNFRITNTTTGQTTSDGFEIIVETSGVSNLINYESSYMDFYVGGNTAGARRMRLDSVGFVGFGATPNCKLQVVTSGTAITPISSATVGSFQRSGTSGNGAYVSIIAGNTGASGLYFGDTDLENVGRIVYDHTSNYLITYVNNAERLRIDSSCNVMVGKTVLSLNVSGGEIQTGGTIVAVVDGGPGLFVSRLSSDGQLVAFYQDGTSEGAISVSGTTITYGSFCGAHWSQLSDNSEPVITKGTVVSTIDEMVVWIAEEWTDSTDDTFHHELYTGALNVDDTYDDGNGDTHTIVQEDNDQLVKFEISTLVSDKRVYGIFDSWDNKDGGDWTGDANIHALGATMIRVTGPSNGGELLESNGDGTAIVQTDQTRIGPETIGKVTFGFPSAASNDENLTPCVLYCG